MSKEKLVFSTDQGSLRKQKAGKERAPASGPTKMRLETKGRGGRSVTVLWNFPFPESEIKEIMKAIQAKKACGATFKGGRLEFQGDIKAECQAYFAEKGWKLVQAGG